MSVVFVMALLCFTHVHSKVYERCELARELKTKHKIPQKQLATWVCIARRESEFNTSAIGHQNADRSGDHGLFQISDIYWCSPPGIGLACGLNCDQLEDDDITDDVICARRIFRAHKRQTGDGFNAWAVYRTYCKGSHVNDYIEGCFDGSTSTAKPRTTSTPVPSTTVVSTTTAAAEVSSTTSETSSVETSTFSTSTVNYDIYSTPTPSSLQKGKYFNYRHPKTVNTFKQPYQSSQWFQIHYDPRFLDEYP